MTTVINPAGTGVPVYNRSGLTISSYTATAGGSRQAIASLSGETIALIGTSGSSPNPQAELPSSPEIGDVVELYNVGSVAIVVYPAAGDSISRGSPQTINDGDCMRFRRIDATTWGVIV